MEKEDKDVRRLRLVFTRHGQTVENQSGILCGHMPGKLTQIGILQAQKIGEWMHQQPDNYRFDSIYVSDLQRAKDTFSSICKKAPHLSKVDVNYVPVLRQKAAGVLQGKKLGSWSQNAVSRKIGIRQFRAQEGQSWQDVNKRCHEFLQLLVTEYLICAREDKSESVDKMTLRGDKQKQSNQIATVLVVSHGGFIMEFHNVFRDLGLNKKPAFDNSAINCSIHQFLIEYPSDCDSYSRKNVTIKLTVNNFIGHLKSQTSSDNQFEPKSSLNLKLAINKQSNLKSRSFKKPLGLMDIFYIGNDNEYIEVDYAKSNRSACRVCKAKIDLDEIRASISINDDHFQGKLWCHLNCFQLKFRFRAIDPYMQIYGLDNLEDEDADKVIAHIQEQKKRFSKGKGDVETEKGKGKKSKAESRSKPKQSKDSGKPSAKSKSKGKVKASKSKGKLRRFEPIDQFDEASDYESPPKARKGKSTVSKKSIKPTKEVKSKKSKAHKQIEPNQGYSDHEKKLFKDYVVDYRKMSIDQLKNILMLNHQVKGGAKDILAERCADGKLLGSIPVCSSCGGGRLRFNKNSGIYTCPGYMEDQDFIHCHVTFTSDQVKRAKWEEI